MFAYLQLLFLVNWLLLVAACFGAWRWGARPERNGAALLLATWCAVVLASLIRDKEFVRGVFLALDGVLALGFLLLALRHATRWLGVAVLLQGVQFSLHAYYLVAARRYDNLFVMVNNLVSLGVLISLLTGVMIAWRKRRTAAK